MFKVAIGHDHSIKEKDINKIIKFLKKNKIDVIYENIKEENYARAGIQTALKVKEKEAGLGIVICGSGIGISIAANKVNKIRAALIKNKQDAFLAKAHNNANVIAFGSRQTSIKKIIKYIDIFINSEFEKGRHIPRINYIKKYENN